VQLTKLPGLLDAMRANRRILATTIGTVDGMVPRRVPDEEGEGGSSLTWFLPGADPARRFGKALRAEGVPCAQLYRGEPVYLTPAILARRTASGKGGPWHCAEHPTTIEYRAGLCPQTEALVARSLTVPVGPRWTPADCADVAEAVHKVARHVLG